MVTKNKEKIKRSGKPKAKLDVANPSEIFGTTPDDINEPTGTFTDAPAKTKDELLAKVDEYEFANHDIDLLVKYKYHKKSTRYNALRNITNEPPRSLKEEDYKHWLNNKSNTYDARYDIIDYFMETVIPERIMYLTKCLVVFTKPRDISKSDYELHISRILSYVGKSVMDKYFYDKIPSVNRWLKPEDLHLLDLLTAFNEGLSDFCTCIRKGEMIRVWDSDLLHLPGVKCKWYTQTDRDFKFKVEKAGEAYRFMFGLSLKDKNNKSWAYFSDEHVNKMSDDIDSIVMGNELEPLFKK